MKAVYILLLLALVGIVYGKATPDRVKELSHPKHPEHSGENADEDDDKHSGEHSDEDNNGHNGDNGDNGGNGDNGDNGDHGDNGGLGLIDHVLKFLCSLLGPLLCSLSLGGLCLKYQ
ncbi:hypothetical protein ALC60_11533 [Trachymyrmex zeteki]|uniref:Uncharacterized protein n=1 Tax=Mycetomoellerius zeteki TaxID=64791 RepID=A0A151WNP7_9HYME|nr:PREDICTED: nacrein-like protein P1 isoform X2 [Trachymyrmex zeteki]KYQ49427.1 hypothetical protein ALC60_11533 [Trachymyrmex zeteki]